MDEIGMAGLFGFVFGVFLAGVSSLISLTDTWREDAIEHGYAEYCSQTGYWAWKGECEATP